MPLSCDTPADANAEALKDATVCVNIANAMLAAKNRDPVAAALGLLPLAAALVNDDAAGRTALAVAMVRTALAMDPDAASVCWQ